MRGHLTQATTTLQPAYTASALNSFPGIHFINNSSSTQDSNMQTATFTLAQDGDQPGAGYLIGGDKRRTQFPQTRSAASPRLRARGLLASGVVSVCVARSLVE